MKHGPEIGADALRLQARAADAESSCRAALAIDPGYAEALSLLGELCADQGRFREAEELFRRAIAADPHFPFGFCGIAAHRKMTAADTAWLEGARSVLARRPPLRHEINLHFALGKYFDDVERYDEAFGHFRQAHELAPQGDYLACEAWALFSDPGRKSDQKRGLNVLGQKTLGAGCFFLYLNGLVHRRHL